jgi:putative MATE family efflux protein
MEKDYNISKHDIRKSILDFSWPIIAELMLMSMIAIVNSSMVGHLGAYALSSVGLTNQPVQISLAVFQAFNIGATALVSRFVGSKDYENAKCVVIQTMIISVILGAIVSTIGFIFAKDLVLFMGAQEDTIISSTMYMRYMAVGVLFQSIPTAVAAILRGAGETKIPMVYNIISNIVNIIVGFFLINGILFFPNLGLQGAAIAATTAKIVACVMAIHALMSSKLPIAVSIKDNWKLNFSMLKRIMDIGLSAAGEQFIMRVGFLLYNKIIGGLGTEALASHQVVNNVTQLLSNVVGGFSTAASSFTGRFLGAQKPQSAYKYTMEINKISLVISVFASGVFFFGGYYITMIFTTDVNILNLSSKVLKVAAFITIPQNYSSIISGSLRGAGDTKYPLVSAFLGIFIARVAIAWTFVIKLGLGLPGAWSAAVIDQCIRSVLLYRRFKTGKWKKLTL